MQMLKLHNWGGYKKQLLFKFMKVTFIANIPNNEEFLRARSTFGDTSGGTLLINNPYKPIPKINMTVPAR